jgi:hypothetical protein
MAQPSDRSERRRTVCKSDLNAYQNLTRDPTVTGDPSGRTVVPITPTPLINGHQGDQYLYAHFQVDAQGSFRIRRGLDFIASGLIGTIRYWLLQRKLARLHSKGVLQANIFRRLPLGALYLGEISTSDAKLRWFTPFSPQNGKGAPTLRYSKITVLFP